jgi:hypothetical protein
MILKPIQEKNINYQEYNSNIGHGIITWSHRSTDFILKMNT